MKTKLSKNRTMCSGCHNNFYNRTFENGCWSFYKATIINRVKVGVWEPPPYAIDRAKEYLSCYHPERFSMLNLGDCRIEK